MYVFFTDINHIGMYDVYIIIYILFDMYIILYTDPQSRDYNDGGVGRTKTNSTIAIRV